MCDNKLSETRKDVYFTTDEMIKCFKSFKGPKDVYKICNNKYDEILNTFSNWLNCLNASMYYTIIADQKVIKVAENLLSFSNSFEDLVSIHQEIFGKDINLLYYIIFYKLNKNFDSMTYSIDDFDYFFLRGTSFHDLANRIHKNEDFIIQFFVEWAFKNKDKKNIIKTYIVGKNRLTEIVTNDLVTKSIKDKISLELYKKDFFSISI